MALLHGAAQSVRETGWRLSIGHVHHGWRGREADRDLAFVARARAAARAPLLLPAARRPGGSQGSRALPGSGRAACTLRCPQAKWQRKQARSGSRRRTSGTTGSRPPARAGEAGGSRGTRGRQARAGRRRRQADAGRVPPRDPRLPGSTGHRPPARRLQRRPASRAKPRPARDRAGSSSKAEDPLHEMMREVDRALSRNGTRSSGGSRGRSSPGSFAGPARSSPTLPPWRSATCPSCAGRRGSRPPLRPAGRPPLTGREREQIVARLRENVGFPIRGRPPDPLRREGPILRVHARPEKSRRALCGQ